MKSTALSVILWVRFSASNGCSTMSWSLIRMQLKCGTAMMNPPKSSASVTNRAIALRMSRWLMATTPMQCNKVAVAHTMAADLYGRYFWTWNTVPCPDLQSRKLVKGMPKKWRKPWALGWWQWSLLFSQFSPRCHFPGEEETGKWVSSNLRTFQLSQHRSGNNRKHVAEACETKNSNVRAKKQD